MKYSIDTNNAAILWMSEKAKIVKTYEGECVVREFESKLPYRMVMDAIKNEKWDSKIEGGQGKNAFWSCSNHISTEKTYGIHYNCATGVVKFTHCAPIS